MVSPRARTGAGLLASMLLGGGFQVADTLLQVLLLLAVDVGGILGLLLCGQGSGLRFLGLFLGLGLGTLGGLQACLERPQALGLFADLAGLLPGLGGGGGGGGLQTGDVGVEVLDAALSGFLLGLGLD